MEMNTEQTGEANNSNTFMSKNEHRFGMGGGSKQQMKHVTLKTPKKKEYRGGVAEDVSVTAHI